jgi:NADH:ubiquinone oxidoreductase subunit C
MKKLVESERFRHLSTITGIDAGSKIEVIYHLIREDLALSLKVKTSKKYPVLPTIVDLIPGAVLYEREVHELLGITFEGNPDLSPLLLPDDWPSDVYPLRKDAAPPFIEKVTEDS